MKSKYYELARQRAIWHAKSQGISKRFGFRYFMPEIESGELSLSSWYKIRVGSQLVFGWISHPKNVLKFEVYEMASERIKHIPRIIGLGADKANRAFRNEDPCNPKVMQKCQALPAGQRINNDWIRAWHREQLDILQSDFSIKPSIDASITPYGRRVDVCHPVEIRSVEGLMEFVRLLRSHLVGKANIFSGLEDYHYTVKQFVQENPDCIAFHQNLADNALQ